MANGQWLLVRFEISRKLHTHTHAARLNTSSKKGNFVNQHVGLETRMSTWGSNETNIGTRHDQSHMGMVIRPTPGKLFQRCGGFLNYGYPQSSSILEDFPSQKTIQLRGYPHCRKPPTGARRGHLGSAEHQPGISAACLSGVSRSMAWSNTGTTTGTSCDNHGNTMILVCLNLLTYFFW